MNYTAKHELMIPLAQLGCPAKVSSQIIGGASFTPLEQHLPHTFMYVAGPMRGIEKLNFPAFDSARDICLAAGYNVISPADIDRHAGDADEATGQFAGQKAYVLRDFWSLFLLASMGNCGIVLLPGWWKSVGATAEFFLARWLGLKCHAMLDSGINELTATHLLKTFVYAWMG